MKAIVFFLILANAIAFAWWNGHLAPWISDGREPDRVSQQVNPERAKLVPLSMLTPPAPTVFPLCVDFPSVPESKAAELEKQLRTMFQARSMAFKIDREASSEGGTYLVYLGPSTNVKDAQRKLTELKRVGVADVALIADGDLKNAISVGMFSTDEAVTTRIQQLAGIGIPGAKATPRSPVVQKAALKVKVADAELKASLLNLSTTMFGNDAKMCGA